MKVRDYIWLNNNAFLAAVAMAVLILVMMMFFVPQPNTKTYTHVAVVTDGMGWPGTGLEWRIENDTLWVFLR